MTARIIHEAVTPVTKESEVIELCEAGRYREAGAALELLDPETCPLAFGMVETARGNQEKAKDLLSRAVRQGEGRARVHLALAYYRTGELQECEAILNELPDTFNVLLSRAVVACEIAPDRALEFLERAAKYEVSPGLQARLHNQRAMTLRKIGETDRCIQEYEAAIHYFEIAQSDWLARAINNLAGIYRDCQEYERAHICVDRAIRLLSHEPYDLARAYDQKAQIFLAENKLEQAERFSRMAVREINATDRRAVLAECLLTHSEILRRLGLLTKALAQSDRAEEIGRFLNDDQIQLKAATKKREIAERLRQTSELRRIECALRMTGSLRSAAKLLNVSHVALSRFMARHKIRK